MKLEKLKNYALVNYDNGGHWVFESFTPDDYQQVLDNNGGNLVKAKKELKEYWEYKQDSIEAFLSGSGL